MRNESRDVLKAALSLWWLRPENGLALASYTLHGFDFTPRRGQQAADFACGDGVNTFFKIGGRFDESFDVFGEGVRTDSAREVLNKSIDVFDHFVADYNPLIERMPDTEFTYGTDHKANLLRKAERLGLYRNLMEADLEEDTPIPDASLDIAYCNSIYWVGNPERAVEYIYRKLKPGGLAVFDVMTSHRKLLHFQNLFPTAPARWHDILNRGRDRNNPGIRSAREWRSIFSANGDACVEDERDIFPEAIAHIWNIGLRPIFPILNRMMQSVPTATRRSIKEEWVEVWTDLLLPVLVEPLEFRRNGVKARLQYVVRKR